MEVRQFAARREWQDGLRDRHARWPRRGLGCSSWTAFPIREVAATFFRAAAQGPSGVEAATRDLTDLANDAGDVSML